MGYDVAGYGSFGEGLRQGASFVDDIFDRRDRRALQQKEMQLRFDENARAQQTHDAQMRQYNDAYFQQHADRLGRVLTDEIARVGGEENLSPEFKTQFHQQLLQIEQQRGLSATDLGSIARGDFNRDKAEIIGASQQFAADSQARQNRGDMLSVSGQGVSQPGNADPGQAPAPRAPGAPPQPGAAPPQPGQPGQNGAPPQQPPPTAAAPQTPPAPPPAPAGASKPGADFWATAKTQDTPGVADQLSVGGVSPGSVWRGITGGVTKLVSGAMDLSTAPARKLISSASSDSASMTTGRYVAMADLNNNNVGRAQRDLVLNHPDVATSNYLVDRDKLSDEARKVVDPLMVPAMTTALHAAQDQYFSGQPGPARDSAATKIRSINATLAEMDGTHSVSAHIGSDGKTPIPAGAGLAATINPAAAPNPTAQAPTTQLRFDKNKVVNDLPVTKPPQAPQPQQAPQSVAGATLAGPDQAPAVGAGMARPTMVQPAASPQPAPAKQPTIDPKVLDAAHRLFMNGGLNVAQYQHILETGTVRPDDLSKLKNYDPSKPFRYWDGTQWQTHLPTSQDMVAIYNAYSERMKAVSEGKKNDAYADYLSGKNQTAVNVAMIKTARGNVPEKEVRDNEKEVMKYLDGWTDEYSKTIGTKTKPISKAIASKEFLGYLVSDVGEQELKDRGINLWGPNHDWNVGRAPVSSMRLLAGVYAGWRTRQAQAQASWNPLNRAPGAADLHKDMAKDFPIRNETPNAYPPGVESDIERSAFDSYKPEQQAALWTASGMKPPSQP